MIHFFTVLISLYLSCLDPFFLDDDEETNVQVEEKQSPVPPQKLNFNEILDQARKNSATNGMGPTPRETKITVEQNELDWEWDGIVDEDAHLGLDWKLKFIIEQTSQYF